MILVVGAKGGVGTTQVAYELARASKAVALDLADGQLAARLERTTWSLGRFVFITAAQRREMVEAIVERRCTLLWAVECNLRLESTWTTVRDIASRKPVVIDGGIAPPEEAGQWSEQVVIVSTDNVVARWHEQQLRARYPHAVVVDGTKEAARALAARLFKSS